MYKVIYQKNNGRVVGVYPFEYQDEIVYIFKDGATEFDLVESEIENFDNTKIEKKINKVESVKVFYDKKTCETVNVEYLPKKTKNQYYVYKNGDLFVKSNYIDYETLVETYIREKYSVSNELAILRQKETKPIEYQEYFEYCEACKTRAKLEIGE